MKRNLAILSIALVILMLSCTKNNKTEFTDIPVIESYLRPGEFLTLTISRQLPFFYGVKFSVDDISSVSITITNNGVIHTLKPLGDGKYIDSALIILEGERYDLSFNYNAMHVYAYTEIPSKPTNFKQSATSISVMRMDSTSTPTGEGGMWTMPEPLTLKWDNEDGSYYIVVFENMEEVLDPVRNFGDEERPEGRFRKAPTTSSGIRIMPQEFQYFGRHRIILYHVLPDYASLYEETNSSSQNLTNPSTSITNGYGIFTGLNSDTLYLQVKELK